MDQLPIAKSLFLNIKHVSLSVKQAEFNEHCSVERDWWSVFVSPTLDHLILQLQKQEQGRW